jgi:cytochrome c-type biogenesis protein CcmH
MVTFSIAAVLLSGVAAILILHRAAGAARRPEVDPTLTLYRRQLDEIDDLADRGLLAKEELRAARAEAGRRLLNAAQMSAGSPASAAAQVETIGPGASRALRLAILACAIAAPILAMGLYLYRGSPGSPDQPFNARLKTWSQADPGQLTAQQLAAVLEPVVASHPGDATPLIYLARAQAAYGNLPAATQTLRKATRVAPKQAELWADLGQLLVMQNQGQENEASGSAFRQAVVLDPKLPVARYHLARAKIVQGDVAGGLADWRALLAGLPPGGDRVGLQREIDATASAGHLVAAPPADSPPKDAAVGAPPQDGAADAGGADQRAFIQSMVTRLAERLRQSPDDPAGWARLIRSYAVLGDAPKMQATLDQAHKVFKNRPDALKTIDNAMAGGQ